MTQQAGQDACAFLKQLKCAASETHGLNIIGESNVCLSYEGLPHETAVLVASDLSDDSMLVAWHNLQPLKVISPNFPARISATMSKALTSGIMKEFPTVFRDEIGELPMNVQKMKIVLAGNAILYRVLLPDRSLCDLKELLRRLFKI